MRDALPDDVVLDDVAFDDQPTLQHPEASRGKRVANFVIDYVARAAGGFALGGAIGVLLSATGREGLVAFEEGSWEWTAFELTTAFAVVLAYYTLCEYFLEGTSLGKLVTGTRAVQVDGSPLRFSHALKRSLWRIVPFEPFSFLGDGPGWHDTQTGTKVVDVRQPRVEVGPPTTGEERRRRQGS